MTRKIFLCLLSLFIFFLGCATHHQTQTTSSPVSEKSFLWEIKSDTTSVFVLGSIHCGRKDLYPCDETIERAFSESESLVVEVNPFTIDQASVNKLIAENGFYKNGESIKDTVSEETFQLLTDYLTDNAIPPDIILTMKPGLLSTTLSMIQIMKMGYKPEYGLDLYFCRKASDGRIPIHELETAEEQLSILLEMPNDEIYLKYLLLNLNRTEVSMAAMISFWKTGNASAMESLVFKDYQQEPGFEPILDRILFERTKKMVSAINQLLTENEKSFVVVGAAHLLGDKGIIALLQKQGFEVRQL